MNAVLLDWRPATMTSPNPLAAAIRRIAAVPGSTTTEAEFQPR
jgi:hypothetical protein